MSHVWFDSFHQIRRVTRIANHQILPGPELSEIDQDEAEMKFLLRVDLDELVNVARLACGAT